MRRDGWEMYLTEVSTGKPVEEQPPVPLRWRLFFWLIGRISWVIR